MKGSEFLRKLKAYAESHGLEFKRLKNRGKGDHQTVFLGSRFTVLPDTHAELKTGTLHGLCKQLGIRPSDL